jgi:hypothetical protein
VPDDVIFKVNANLTEDEIASLLGRIRELPGVVAAAPVRPNSTAALARQLCFARLDVESDAGALADMLQQLPEIAYAEVPPKRTIAGS